MSSFQTGGRAELDARIPGFKKLVLQPQKEVAKFLFRTQERVARSIRYAFPDDRAVLDLVLRRPAALDPAGQIPAIEQGDESILDVRRRRGQTERRQ